MKIDKDKLQKQVEREYNIWFNYIRNIREYKRDIAKKVLDSKLPDWQVRVNLLWKNIQLENALFLTDNINIEFLSNKWILWDEIMKNANLVAKYDYEDMDLYWMSEDIVNHNWLYWLSATIIDWWDDEEKQPISNSLNPLNLIIDPKNYKDSKMRFIWVERRINEYDLENNPNYKIPKDIDLDDSISAELDKTERSYNNVNYTVTQIDNEWMVDIYDHFCVFEWKKYLSTWINERNDCIRLVELEPLTNSEKLNPNKIKFPIQLHRRKPKYWSVFGVSIADEVLVYQDIISQLTNLQLLNARIQALWPDIFIDNKLWVDTSLLWQGKPWWRVIPIQNQTNMPTQNGIYAFTPPNPSQYTDNLIMTLEQRAEETTNVWKQSFWISQTWSQTKAEIQTLQQNSNTILTWISNNYLRWLKDYWIAHYRSYALNFSKWKKSISLFQKWQAFSLDLKKSDFIADWKVQLTIVSKNQLNIENEKEFNKLIVLVNSYLPNITSEYAKNELLRLMWSKSNITDFDSKKYIRESTDEIRARQQLDLLNLNKEVAPPTINDDIDTYIDIYKQAMDTPAKYKALNNYLEMAEYKKEQWLLQQEQWIANNQVNNTAMNNINQNANMSPSTQWIGL